ncbi:MAG TPA: tetratricopeptide repeat protein [Ktedonobacteraceae bacterium]
MTNKEHLVGQQIGNYCLEAFIDSGSYGSVYQARHHIFNDDPPVALKLMHADLDTSEDQEAFLQEARLLRKLKHPAILPVIDVGFDLGRPYLVTQYAPGGSLRTRLRNWNGQALPLTEALRILLSIGHALAHAHQHNVFHRDLKPENILFNEQGEPLLADFGIAVAPSTAQTFRAGQGGTPAYMAPEQFEGLISPKSDQYSLGCVGYEMLTGRRPFDAGQGGFEMIWYQHAHIPPEPPTRLNPALPEVVEEALLRALAKDRSARYRDVSAFLRDVCDPFFSESSQHVRVTISTQRHGQEHVLAIRAGGLRFRGEALYDDERYQDALLFFQRVVALNPTDVHAYARLGDTLFMLGRYGDALDAYGQALELDPNNALYEVERAKALLALNYTDRALEACARAQQLDPLNAAAYGVQGTIYAELGLDEGALPCYQRAVELDPQNPRYYQYRGDALRWLERYEQALEAYDRALALKPVSRDAYARLLRARAHISFHQERYTAALEFYDRTLDLNDGDLEAIYYKGQALYQSQRFGEALEAFGRALALKPDFASCHAFAGYTLYQLERFEEALLALDRALAIEGDDAMLYNARGNILYTLQRYTEALQMFDRAINLVPENRNYQVNRTNTLEKLPTH